MKIGIVLHPYGEKQPGGLPRMILEWTKAMLEVDRKNEYIIFLKHEPKEPPKLPGKNWHYEVLAPLEAGRLRPRLLMGLWLDRLRSKPRADVYIFNTPVLPLFWTPPKSIVIALDFPYKYLKAPSLKLYVWHFLLGAYHSLSLKRADLVVAISLAAKEDVMKLFGVPEKKIKYIPQGYINICAVPETPVKLPEKFFLFVSAVKERKNVRRIVEAFNQFAKGHPETGHSLVLVGRHGGPYYEKIIEYVRKNNIEKQVIFLGHRNDGELSYIYRRAEAVLFPSIIEATGNPIIEGMHCGVPVITSNICGPAELGSDGSAILIDPYNVGELKEAMERVVFDSSARTELIRKGKEQVKKFQWPEAGKRMVEAAEQLVQR